MFTFNSQWSRNIFILTKLFSNEIQAFTLFALPKKLESLQTKSFYCLLQSNIYHKCTWQRKEDRGLFLEVCHFQLEQIERDHFPHYHTAACPTEIYDTTQNIIHRYLIYFSCAASWSEKQIQRLRSNRHKIHQNCLIWQLFLFNHTSIPTNLLQLISVLGIFAGDLTLRNS